MRIAGNMKRKDRKRFMRIVSKYCQGDYTIISDRDYQNGYAMTSALINFVPEENQMTFALKMEILVRGDPVLDFAFLEPDECGESP